MKNLKKVLALVLAFACAFTYVCWCSVHGFGWTLRLSPKVVDTLVELG